MTKDHNMTEKNQNISVSPNLLKNFNPFVILEPTKEKENISIKQRNVGENLLIDLDISNECDNLIDFGSSSKKFDLVDLYENINVTPGQVQSSKKCDSDISSNLRTTCLEFDYLFDELYKFSDNTDNASYSNVTENESKLIHDKNTYNILAITESSNTNQRSEVTSKCLVFGNSHLESNCKTNMQTSKQMEENISSICLNFKQEDTFQKSKILETNDLLGSKRNAEDIVVTNFEIEYDSNVNYDYQQHSGGTNSEDVCPAGAKKTLTKYDNFNYIPPFLLGKLDHKKPQRNYMSVRNFKNTLCMEKCPEQKYSKDNIQLKYNNCVTKDYEISERPEITFNFVSISSEIKSNPFSQKVLPTVKKEVLKKKASKGTPFLLDNQNSLTRGPTVMEKSLLLPQILERIEKRKSIAKEIENLHKKIIITKDAAKNLCIQENDIIPVNLNPVVVMADCNRQRLIALKQRQKFEQFVLEGKM